MKFLRFCSPALLAFLGTAALVGCASTTPLGLGECKNVDWYQYGWRDGSQSGRSDLEQYNAHCAAFGVKPDAAQYAKGLGVGQWERANRRF